MTPAERARQIDREEFAAECAAVRQRAYARYRINTKRDARVDAWIKRGYEPHVRPLCMVPSSVRAKPALPETARRPAVMHNAFGRSQSLHQWAEEFGIVIGTIRNRLRHGWTLERALETAPADVGKRVHRAKPGVPSDFAPSSGTGAGSTAQETPNITFSREA